MPELPEVETVVVTLQDKVLGLTFDTPTVYVHRLIQTDEKQFVSLLKGKTILSLSRRGKWIIFHLSEKKKLLFHLRMEGKIFVVLQQSFSSSHLSLFMPFEHSPYGLAFYDVRKFGCAYFLDEGDLGPLKTLGKEPFEYRDGKEFYDVIHPLSKPLKEILMNQTIISGIGNIYADEICFASRLSPFKLVCSLTVDECKNVIENAKKILQQAIDYKGTTVKSYQSSENHSGEYQEMLKVYGREGKECLVCHQTKIEKRRLGGRSVSYCPLCQKTGINVAVTGKIASGKSLVTSYFKEEGFCSFSADDEVHKMYHDPIFLAKLKCLFPMIFTPKLDKKKITSLLSIDKKFKRTYETFIFKEIKKKINDFIIENDAYDKVFEIPLLFDSHMEKDFTFTVGVETTQQEAHLRERGESIERMKFNRLNSYDRHRDTLDYIIHSDGTKEELKKQVICLINRMKS